MATAAGAGNSAGLTWWMNGMMNGAPYEDSPPPAVIPIGSLAPLHQQQTLQQQQPTTQQQQQQQVSQQQQQQQQVPTPGSPGAPASAATSQQQPAPASSSSPSASSVASSGAAPLHIPAKRLSATPAAPPYADVGCAEANLNGAGVIRHSTGSSAQSWSGYSPHHQQDPYAAADSLLHHQTYGSTNPPAYYSNLASEHSPTGGSRERKPSVNFWSPVGSTSGASTVAADYKTEYKYNPASAGAAGVPGSGSAGSATGSEAAVSSHHSFSQSWNNYYSSARHHSGIEGAAAHHHSQTGVSYLAPSAAEDRSRVAAAMVAEAFPHDGYSGLRNYAPEPVATSPYAPAGKHRLRLVILLLLLILFLSY